MARPEVPGIYEVRGHALGCQVCAGRRFYRREPVEVSGEQIVRYVCKRCGAVISFVRD